MREKLDDNTSLLDDNTSWSVASPKLLLVNSLWPDLARFHNMGKHLWQLMEGLFSVVGQFLFYWANGHCCQLSKK